MAKTGTKARSNEGTKAKATAETAVPPAEQTEEKAMGIVIGEELDVCPECPPGMHRLRSRFRSYRFAGVQFHAHTAIVDEATFQKAKRSPHFGQGPGFDFWEDLAAA